MDCTFYEPRFWGLDPVFSSKVKLNVCEVFSLNNYPGFQDVYCLLNHPIGHVHILGDVVSIAKKTKMIKYEVDDGTSVIACVQWRKSDDSDEGIFIPKLGQLVSVFGKVSEFRGERQLTVSSICPETDPNIEPLFWLEVIKLKKEVYSKPFVLPPGATAKPTVRLQELIQSEVSNYLDKTFASKTFTLEELEGEQSLIEDCLRVAQEQGAEYSRAQIQQELKGTIAKLPFDGKVVPTGARQGQSQLYKVLHQQDLVKVIVKYLSRREESPKVIQFGVPEDWIIEHVKQIDYLCHVPRQTIVAAIAFMVDNSLIFPVGPKSYRRV